MSSNPRSARTEAGATVRDRSGAGLPPKAERRALGKAAARKRAEQRRRREILNRAAQIAAPIVVVGIIVGAVYFFGRGPNDNSTEPVAGATTPAATSPAPAATPWSLPEGFDPQLAVKPVVTAGDGQVSELKVTTIVQGTGAAVATGDVLEVNYVGVYYNNAAEFDSTWKTDPPTPAQFPIGVGRVIPGWDQGLVGLQIGSRVQLDIPVALAYNHAQGYPDGDLRFVVDILGVSTS